MLGPYRISFFDELQTDTIQLNVPTHEGAVQIGVAFPSDKQPLLVRVEQPEIHISRPGGVPLQIDRVENDDSFTKLTTRHPVFAGPIGTLVLRRAEQKMQWLVEPDGLEVTDELGLKSFLHKIAEYASFKQSQRLRQVS